MSDPDSTRPSSTDRIGKRMWLAMWIIGFALLTYWFGQKEASWINPNSAPTTQLDAEGNKEVQLLANRQGQYQVSGSINGHPIDFLLDTGATDVTVSDQLAQQLGMPRGARSAAMTANGVVEVFASRIDRLQIGDIVLYDVGASINPAMDNFVLLGMSALSQLHFSQQGDRLTLKQFQDPDSS